MTETSKKLTIMLLLVLGLIFCLILSSSCSANKYGCGHGHPKQTWSKMVKRINSK